MSDDDDRPIGNASMTEDRTLVLDLVAEGQRGERGKARLVYPEGHPEYAPWIAHLGGIEPGEQKLVPPWPEPPQA